MLQKIDGLEWPLPDGLDGRRLTARYDGSSLWFVDVDDPFLTETVDFPDGVVLAQEVDAPAPADPFAGLEYIECPECDGIPVDDDVDEDGNHYVSHCGTCNGWGRVYLRPAAGQEVQPPADPFMPDWSQAPRWASWSTVDWTGHWSFWQYAPRHESIWYCGSGDMITLDDDGDAVLDMTGRDDRNSLRHRPA